MMKPEHIGFVIGGVLALSVCVWLIKDEILNIKPREQIVPQLILSTLTQQMVLQSMIDHPPLQRGEKDEEENRTQANEEER